MGKAQETLMGIMNNHDTLNRLSLLKPLTELKYEKKRGR